MQIQYYVISRMTRDWDSTGTEFANSLCIFEEREPEVVEKTYNTLKVVRNTGG